MIVDTENPHALYVIAAYALTVIALLGMVLMSYWALRREKRDGDNLQKKSLQPAP